MKFITSWKGLIMVLLVVGFSVTGCYQQYYRTHTQKTTDADMIQKLQASNKYFIIHLPDRIAALQNLSVKGDFIEADEVNVSPAHQYEFNPRISIANVVNKKHIDSVLLEVHLYTSNTIVKGNHISIPLSSVNRMDVYEFDMKATKTSKAVSTVGIVVGSIAVATLLLFAATCNCPQVYIDKDNNQQFNGGLYSGAIYSTLERMDYMPVPISEKSDKIKISIGNVPEEEQFINSISLLEIKHTPDIRVLMDRHGKILSYTRPVAAVNVVPADISHKLEYKDGLDYTFSNETKSHTSSVILNFKRTGNQKKARLILAGRNSAWSGFIFKEFSGLFGKDAEKWRQRQENGDAAVMQKWQEDQSLPIMAYIKIGNQWKYIDHFSLAGNTAERDMIMEVPLEDHSGETVTIKLETVYRFWQLDYAAIDFSDEPALGFVNIDPAKAVSSAGDQKINLMRRDNQYARLCDKDVIELEFPVVPDDENTSSYFLAASGYYHSLKKYSGKMQTAKLLSIKARGGFDAFSRSRYREINEELSRYAVNTAEP